MFKAKLIESENYYKHRKKQILFMLMPAIPFAYIITFMHLDNWLVNLMMGLYVVIVIIMSKNLKELHKAHGVQMLELDESEIRIKSKKGIEETIKLSEVNKLTLKEYYPLPQKAIKDIGSVRLGKTIKNFLTVQHKQQSRTLHFELDSYHMVNQLNNCISSWKNNNLNIVSLSNNEL